MRTAKALSNKQATLKKILSLVAVEPSARLAGFGTSTPGLQEVFVHDDEKINAVEIIKMII